MPYICMYEEIMKLKLSKSLQTVLFGVCIDVCE